MWCFGWFVIPLIGWPFTYIAARKTTKSVVTYTDKVINNIWIVLGIMFFFAIIILMFTNTMNIMLPLSLILCSLGTSFTGIIICDKWLTFAPGISFIMGMFLLGMIGQGSPMDITWFLIFGACYIIMMIIPGHLLNHKAKKENV